MSEATRRASQNLGRPKNYRVTATQEYRDGWDKIDWTKRAECDCKPGEPEKWHGLEKFALRKKAETYCINCGIEH